MDRLEHIEHPVDDILPRNVADIFKKIRIDHDAKAFLLSGYCAYMMGLTKKHYDIDLYVMHSEPIFKYINANFKRVPEKFARRDYVVNVWSVHNKGTKLDIILVESSKTNAQQIVDEFAIDFARCAGFLEGDRVVFKDLRKTFKTPMEEAHETFPNYILGITRENVLDDLCGARKILYINCI